MNAISSLFTEAEADPSGRLPGASAFVVMSFVMNPEKNLKLYNDGKENLEIYLHLIYSSVRNGSESQRYWYKCNWVWGSLQFSVLRSESDPVRP